MKTCESQFGKMAKSWDKFEEATMARCRDHVSCGCPLLCPLPQVRGWVCLRALSVLHYIRDPTLLDMMVVPKLPLLPEHALGHQLRVIHARDPCFPLSTQWAGVHVPSGIALENCKPVVPDSPFSYDTLGGSPSTKTPAAMQRKITDSAGERPYDRTERRGHSFDHTSQSPQ